MASKINDVHGAYPRKLRMPLGRAVSASVKMLRLRGALEMAWTLNDAYKNGRKRRGFTERCSFCPKKATVKKVIAGSIGSKIPLCNSCWRKS